MFSGIIEEKAKVISCDGKNIVRITIQSSLDHHDTKLGDSICIDGVCLTVVEIDNDKVSFELSEETLRRSTLGYLKEGSFVNLERSLKIGQRIHGHFVFGHVDGCGRLEKREKDGKGERLVFSFNDELRHYIVEKGSIAVSGISLTVGEVQENTFAVYIIPHTDKVTTLSEIQLQDKVNLEVDMLGRYVVAKLLEASKVPVKKEITAQFLRDHGFMVDLV